MGVDVKALRERIRKLAQAAWEHGVNPWADSYREDWPDIMAREKPCEALVLALRPDVVLALCDAAPADPVQAERERIADWLEIDAPNIPAWVAERIRSGKYGGDHG